MMGFKEKYAEYSGYFEETLKKYCAEMNYQPSVLTESMRYSLLSGGKRVRPVLFFAALDCFGHDYRTESALALALECVHTYSLIHDDLPAMDDDDYRRGNPSNHKVYGEANAILAGDGLLSVACALLLGEAKRDGLHLRAARYFMDCAGPKGMIAGQSADLLYTGKSVGKTQLDFIYAHKTGKLIAAPIVMAAILSGGNERAAEAFGAELGYLFQLTDDLLDEKGDSGKMGKTLGKDKLEDKLTCVKVYGIEKSELLADMSAARCVNLLKEFGGNSFLEDMVAHVRARDN